jgi:hypothetical protein
MMGFFRWIRRVFSVKGVTHQQSALLSTRQKARGQMAVRRFQGRFSCGCAWPKDVLCPEECPDHPGASPVYLIERVEEMTNVTVSPEVREA